MLGEKTEIATREAPADSSLKGNLKQRVPHSEITIEDAENRYPVNADGSMDIEEVSVQLDSEEIEIAPSETADTSFKKDSSSLEDQKRLKDEAEADFNETVKRQRLNRLNFLLKQAGTYSKWLGAQLEKRQSQKSQEGKELKELPESNDRKDSETNDLDVVTMDANMVEADSGVGPKVVRQSTRHSNANETATAEPKSQKRRADQSSESKASKRTKTSEAEALLLTATAHLSGSTAANPNTETKMTNKAERSHRQPASIVNCVMREYQLVGMEWLISLWEQGLNGILADEMGLGKTLQTISFLAHLVEMGIWGPFLIVAPLSTLGNWISEIEKFAPSLPAVLYHGTPDERSDIRTKRLTKLRKGFPIVVTSYTLIMNDRKYLSRINWKYIIVDEGHRLKNMNCRLIRELKTYPSANRLILSGTPLQNNLTELWSLLNFLMPDIFESIEDFESWFNFDDIENENAGNVFGEESTLSLITQLHEILKPFLLRRVKTEVELDLPPKREFLVFAPMTPRQKELYDACLMGVQHLRKLLLAKAVSQTESNVEPEPFEVSIPASPSAVAKENENQTPSKRQSKRLRRQSQVEYEEPDSDSEFEAIDSPRPALDLVKQVSDPDLRARKSVGAQNLQVTFVQLLKVCNHPYLFDVPVDLEQDFDMHAEIARKEKESRLKSPHKDSFSPNKSTPNRRSPKNVQVRSPSSNLVKRLPDIVKCCGKMLVLERLLPELFSRGHKVLIFSQMTNLLDILADWFEFIKNWNFCRIDGTTSIEDRQAQMKEFNTNSEVKLFLLSTRSGGLGINLTSADTVIIYDSDWNPQMDLQAQDRAHRIGQTKPVVIYRLVTESSFEQRVIDRASKKRKLEKLVIHQSEFKGSSKYYKSVKKKSSVNEFMKLLLAEEAEAFTASNSEGRRANSLKNLESVISSSDLERLLDRSFSHKSSVTLPHDINSKSSAFQEVIEEEGEERNLRCE